MTLTEMSDTSTLVMQLHMSTLHILCNKHSLANISESHWHKENMRGLFVWLRVDHEV